MSPLSHETVTRSRPLRAIVPALGLTLALAGCMGGTPFPSMQAFSPAGQDAALGQTPGTSAETSAVIADLQRRRSILPANGPYAQIGQSVLTASRGKAEADLRVARLTAEAQSKNWLPKIGPEISLSSLGDLVASLVIEQTLFDNGGKRAEREFAAADVEVAAVAYSNEMNERVADGLTHYLSALRAAEYSAVAGKATTHLREFDRIMHERVEGGLSDMSEARVISQKLSEMDALAQSEADNAQTAWAQLAAMSDRDLSGLRGLSSVDVAAYSDPALTVSMAQAVRGRSIAQAKMARAGYLPTVSAASRTTKDGTNGALNVSVGNMLGLGTGKALEALEATEQSADAAVEEARQTAEIERVALMRKLDALQARYQRDANVTAEAEAGIGFFTEQYKVGRRTLLELVGQYEQLAQMQRSQVALKYDIEQVKIDLARNMGLLADGTSI